jgi:hypothetical protein
METSKSRRRTHMFSNFLIIAWASAAWAYVPQSSTYLFIHKVLTHLLVYIEAHTYIIYSFLHIIQKRYIRCKGVLYILTHICLSVFTGRTCVTRSFPNSILAAGTTLAYCRTHPLLLIYIRPLSITHS